MSLKRFTNTNSFIKLNQIQYGQVFTTSDLNILDYKTLVPEIDSVTNYSDRIVTEVHVYSFNGDYIGSSTNPSIITDKLTRNFFVDISEVFKIGGIINGSYKIIINILTPVFGRPTKSDILNIQWPAALIERSPNGKEVKFQVVDDKLYNELDKFKDFINKLSGLDLLNNLIVNFGLNRANKVLNIKFDRYDKTIFYVKFYNELDDSINELDKAWFALEISDPYMDSIILTSKVENIDAYKIKGPRFNIDVDNFDSNSTVLQSWNDILDTDAPTQQRIIDSFLSSSNSVRLNIDYTDYENFIFYSSAKERVENFIYKISLIEQYQRSIQLLQTSPSTSLQTTIEIEKNNNRISNIQTNFDSYERWMYYQGNDHIFTHDLSGSNTPYPKYISGSSYIPYSLTSSQATQWYSASIEIAQHYDEQNGHSFWWSIPEHMLMDPNNSDYVLFVQMVAQHFDNMYGYINAMTQIHSRDEHLERGPSNELLWYIGKHFGWDLQNSRQLSDLWLYKLGTNNSGSNLETDVGRIQSHELQTKQVWRRIVNNLPYLLKTKGTSRSVKALMSIYGIPQTLISIKEYGGPGLDINYPIYTEQRFQYKLVIDSSSYVETNRDINSFSINGWKGNVNYIGSSSVIQPREPDTYEFRFDTKVSGSSGSMMLFANSSSLGLYHVSLISPVTIGSNILVSGSDRYGKLLLEYIGSGYATSSIFLPIYDDDLWTVRIHKDPYPTETSSSLKLDIARSADNLYGRIAHEDSISLIVPSYKLYNSSSGKIYLGGAPSSLISYIDSNSIFNSSYEKYTGYVQGYKEYYVDYSYDTFIEHVQNPGAYHTDTISGSYYSLYKYFPLGLDVQRWSHQTDRLYMSSSQPDQSITSSLLYFRNFTGSQTDNYHSDQETFYIKVPSLGGTTVQSEKIRIENTDVIGELSPTNYSTKSNYDETGFDSNRLAIVFSVADHINRDIYNHMGFESIDSWIGDPELEFEGDYTELRLRRHEYFQKYVKRNDINAFIRILSAYDYTFFEQIKQLTPGRADLIAGILIEPTILERSKVIVSRRPQITNPQWETLIPVLNVSQSGEYPVLESNILHTSSIQIKNKYYSGSYTLSQDINIKNKYYSGSYTLSQDINIKNKYYTSSIEDPTEIITKLIKSTDWCGVVVIRDPYSGSYSVTQSIVDKHIVKCGYFKKILYYTSSNSDRYKKEFELFSSRSREDYYSSSLQPYNYQYEECSDSFRSRFIGSKLVGTAVNIDSKDTVDGGPVITIKESNPNFLGSNNNSEGNIIIK